MGDKRGELHLFEKANTKTEDAHPTGQSFLDGTINGETTTRPSPIFSLDVAPDNTLVFSGAGNRYVSVWEKDKDDGKHWSCLEKLGPHTGWVRSVLYKEYTGRLHSIGCNCIESWCQMTDSGKWEHWKKSTIESSPSDGATLSSDLLCLCPMDDDTPYFVAGGVDGRLHVWNSHTMDAPLFSTAAVHDGRVNAMNYSKKSGLLFTAGNDGTIRCWNCRVQEQCMEMVGEFNVGQDSRVTCIWVDDFGGSQDHIFCGTNAGEVLLSSLRNKSVPWKLATTFQLAGRPIVNSLCIQKDAQGKPNLWIGHSKGLSIFALDNFASLKSLSA